MRDRFQPPGSVIELTDELVDGLHLLYECRRRGVTDVDRLLEYLEHLMDEIERHRLGMSRELFITMLDGDETDALATVNGSDKSSLSVSGDPYIQ